MTLAEEARTALASMDKQLAKFDQLMAEKEGSMTLGDKQRLFARLVGEFLLWIYANDFEVTFGEAQRSQAQADVNAASGAGISNSLHLKRLAIDLNLFIKDVYQASSEAHTPLGEKWESMHPLCRWGGRFSKPDGNHYSLEHEGVK